MTEPETPEPLDSPPHTAWHPMLVALLEHFLPRGFRLLSEFQLTRLPQRVDILVVRLLEADHGTAERIHSILDYLGAHTLIEHKGPTDEVSGEDCSPCSATPSSTWCCARSRIRASSA